MNLKGQVAIVTGGVQGIGRAIALNLAKDGASVLVSYVGSDVPAKETLDLIKAEGGTAVSFNGDQSVKSNIEAMFAYCEEALGKPDILVANAGVCFPPKPMLEITEEDYETIFKVNVKGSLFCILEAAKRLNDGGRIVAISSSQVINPQAGGAIYTAGKGALEAFIGSVSPEFAARGISINAVRPGLTLTPLALGDLPEEFLNYQREGIPYKRLGMPEDIANVVRFFCDKSSQWVSGQYITANGGSKF